MAKSNRRGEKTTETTETTETGNQQETNAMDTSTTGSNPTDEQNEQNTGGENTGTTETTEERPIVDILVVGPNVPPSLVKRFTNEQRDEIRRLFQGPTPEDERSWGAGHENPDIIRELRRSIITKETSKTPKDESWAYWGYIGVTEAGRVALSGGNPGISGRRVATEDGYGVWEFAWKAADGSDRKPKGEAEIAEKEALERWGVGDFFDYGFDLDIRQPVRSMLSEAIKGDVQKLLAQVRGMVRIKVAKTHRAAFRMLVAQREDEGEPMPEGLTYESLGITADEEAATGVKR